MTADEGLTAPVPHQHGGTDAPECTPFGIPCRPSTPADDGLPAAVARVMGQMGCVASCEGPGNEDLRYCCVHGSGWLYDVDACAHAEAVARAAREDVAETVREARAAELEAAAERFRDEGRSVMFNHAKDDLSPEGRVVKWVRDRSAAIRAGEA